jgi:hypothetical protein
MNKCNIYCRKIPKIQPQFLSGLFTHSRGCHRVLKCLNEITCSPLKRIERLPHAAKHTCTVHLDNKTHRFQDKVMHIPLQS